MTDATDGRLAAQYEAYPYPKRDPRDEAKRLIIGSPSHLREIDHWVFGAARPPQRRAARPGRRRRHRRRRDHAGPAPRARRAAWRGHLPRPLRCRAGHRSGAGGGEGAHARHGSELSLLDLPGSGLGPFDYIDCCGVLHHLPDPAPGLRALLSVLAPGGGLGLMVYAPHGRTGVYMLQDALRPARARRRSRRRRGWMSRAGSCGICRTRPGCAPTAISATISRAATPGCTTCC